MTKVLVAFKTSESDRSIIEEILAEIAVLEFVDEGTRDELIAKIRDADIVIAGYLPKSVLENAEKLKFIQTVTAGVDRYDFEYLRKRNIFLASSKGCNARQVAEHAFALLLALAKRVTVYDNMMKEGKWVPYTRETMVEDLEDKILGIIGYGNIGREIAKIAKAFNMKIYAIKRNPSKRDSLVDFLGTFEDIEYVLSVSDFVIVALPLTEDTYGSIGEKQLSLMKKTAYIINISRGAVIDENALYKALVDGWISGAGIDVWWFYPPDPRTPSQLKIHKLNSVIATPHKAGWTRHAREKCIRFACQNVRRYIEKKEVLNIVDYDSQY